MGVSPDFRDLDFVGSPHFPPVRSPYIDLNFNQVKIWGSVNPDPKFGDTKIPIL